MYSYPNPNSVPPTPSPTQGADDSLIGGYDQTLVNNDIRHELVREIEQTNKVIQTTKSQVQQEQLAFHQLTKDCNHRRDELFERRRAAAEVLESEGLTEEYRANFKASFAKDVSPHLVSPSSSNHGGYGGISDQDDEMGERTSHSKFIPNKRADISKKKNSILSIQEEIKATHKKTKQAEEDTARFTREMESKQLDKVKMDGERQVAAKKKSLEAEIQRNRGVKDSVQVARANSGAYAQQIAEKAKEQMSEHSSNKSKEQALTSINEGKKQELELLEADEKKLDKELEDLTSQLDFLVKQAAEFEAEQKKSIAMKVETEEVQSGIIETTSSKEAKTKEAEASNADLQLALESFEQANTAVAESNAEKRENDKAVIDVLEPANVRKADAIKEKEKIAGEIVELQKSIEQAQTEQTDAASSSDAKVIAKSNELKEQKAKLDKARADFEEMQKNDIASAETRASELKEYKEFASTFEAATKAEVDRLAVLRRERVDARVEHLERRKSDLATLEDGNTIDIENLKECKSYLQEMKAVQSTIENEPLLDRNGEAITLPSYSQESGWGGDENASVDADAGSIDLD